MKLFILKYFYYVIISKFNKLVSEVVCEKMVKVGLFGRFPPEEGGIVLFLKNLTENLDGKCDIVKIGLGRSDSDYKVSMSNGLIKDVKRIVKKEGIDVLHIQYIASGKHLDQKSRFKLFGYVKTMMANLRLIKLMDIDVPKIVTLNELQTSPRNLKDRIVRWFERMMIKKADKVIVYAPSHKKILSDKGVDVEWIYYGLRPMDVIKEGGKNILFQGVINPEKGLEYLIRAMKSLPDYRLIIKGLVINPSYAKMLKNEIEKNGLKNVKLGFGWITEEEKEKLYRSADIVILPYLWAPYQSAGLNEAFAYRIPVVVTRTGPINETVEKFNCGVVVEPRNPEQIAEGVKEVYKNYKNYMPGIDKFRQLANWKNVADKHLKVYEEVAKTSN